MERKDKERVLAEEYKAQVNAQDIDGIHFLNTEELAQMNPFTDDLEGIDLFAYRTQISSEDYLRLHEIDAQIEPLKSEIESCNGLLNDPKLFYGDKKEILEDLHNAENEVYKLKDEIRQIMDKYEFGNRNLR